MAALSLALLGPFQATYNGRPLRFRTNKARALLSFLAVEDSFQSGLAHRREALMELLWPEMAQLSAQDNLRQILYQLRKAIPEADSETGDGPLPFILAERLTVQINPACMYELDVATFTKSLETNPEGATALYRGDFLADFYLPDSSEFESWASHRREALRQQALKALEQLAAKRTANGAYDEAESYARRQLEIDNLRESAYRQLMVALAQSGRRHDALLQYELCYQTLSDELGVEPSPDTKSVYEAIRAGQLQSLASAAFTLAPAKRFVEEEQLATGGHGEIFRGRDIQEDQTVILKRLRQELAAQNPEMVARFAREGRVLSQLDHPNIVKILATFEKEGQTCIVMEFVPGGSLRDLLERESALPLERVLAISLELADALARAHHLNIIHRDIKPGNVLLAEDGTPRLTDFGVARFQQDPGLTRTGAFIGSPAYMSPETLQGEEPDAISDIWSFGVLLYEMLAGRHPFAGQQMATVFNRILNEPVPDLAQFRPDAPADLVNLVARLLVKDRAKRPASMRQVAAELEAIQQGRTLTPMPLPEPEAQLPAFLADVDTTITERGRFVARTEELARLNEHLSAAAAGSGRVVFVTGGAGRGKTTLLAEFSRRAQDENSELIVTTGNCNAFAGVGDPYLPFREVMALLTGEVEARWAAGEISANLARRLWQLAPTTAQAIAERGPNLIDVFVSGRGVLSRAKATASPGAAWVPQLEELVGRRPSEAGSLKQSGLFGQFTDVLRQLAERRPLLIMLDDLQWADEASIGLLFHLGRRLTGSRMLIVGAYRPDELVAQARNEGGHPLEKAVSEFQRTYGNVWIDLAAADLLGGRAFVDAYLDAEPNHLSEAFRQTLFRQTGGHPLFTVELLGELQLRRHLVKDEDGYWCEDQELDWESMPARVEAVIARRLNQLDVELRDILTVASVEGEQFTAEVVARACNLGRRELVERLSGELVKRHGLVVPQGVRRLETTRQQLSRYRFAHNLFQKYLYQELDPVERAYQHEVVGTVLEALYGDQVDEVAVQLARHFQEAGLATQAIEYLGRAGQRAMRLSANEEAIMLLGQGVRLLEELPQTPDRDRQTLNLQLALGEAQRKVGLLAESLDTFQRSAGIARELGSPEELARAVLGYEESRWRFNLPAEPAARLLEEALQALGEEENVLRVRVWVNLTGARMTTIEPEQLRPKIKQAVEVARKIDDPPALYRALTLLIWGDRRPKKSAERLAALEEMLRLAQEAGDTEGIQDVHGFLALEHLERGDYEALKATLNDLFPLIKKHRQRFHEYWAALIQTTAAIMSGRFEEAEQLAQQSLEIGRKMRVESVEGAFGVQMFTIRREQGRLGEVAPLVKLIAEQNPGSVAWRPGLALIYSELGLESEAHTEFELLAHDNFADLPQDAMWVTSIAYLTEVCAYLGDQERAATLYELMAPYAGRTVVVGFLSACFGAASRYLGMLATALSRWDEAEQHFQDALEMNARMEARPWLAHTQQQYATMLLAKGLPEDRDRAMALLTDALETAHELGMTTLIKKVEVML